MLRHWLADAALLCTVPLLVLYYASPRASPCLGRTPLVALPAVGYALLACCWLGSSACCWLCSSRFFSSFLPCSTMSAALRAHRRFDVLLAVLVPVLLYFVLLAPGSLAGVLSLLLSRDTLWLFTVSWMTTCSCGVASSRPLCGSLLLRSSRQAPPMPLGSRKVLGLRSCSLQQRVLLTVRAGLRGSLPLRSVGGFQFHSNTTVVFSGLCPPSQRMLTSRPLATAWSVGSFGTAGVSSIPVSLSRLVLSLSLSLSHATSLHVCS